MKKTTPLFVLLLGIVVGGLKWQQNNEIPNETDPSISRKPLAADRPGSNYRSRPSDIHSIKKTVLPYPAHELSPSLIAAREEDEPSIHREEAESNQMDLRTWARNSVKEAIRWLADAPAGEEREAVLESVCGVIVETSPEQALILAGQYGDEGTRPMIENYVMRWAASHPGAAYAYAAAEPPGEHRNRLLGRVAYSYAAIDPTTAATIVALEISPGPSQDESAVTLLNQWLRKDPASARQWVEAFPESDLRDRMLAEVNNADLPANAE